MNIYLKEKIGNPDLFTGRKEELRWYLNWINRIKQELSMSQALLARRKTGKTALLQRLYNLTFEKNDGVIPFYYEIGEGKKWAVNFSKDFFLTFLYQYIAFKTRKTEYLRLPEREKHDFAKASEIAGKEGLDYLIGSIEGIAMLVEEAHVDTLWPAVIDAPYLLATRQNESIVQFIDEFQFLNSEICRDKEATQPINDFAAGYMRTAEYKNAPLLVSGSWVGWLFNDLIMMLPGRFQMNFLESLPQDEAVEMVFKYSQLEQVPVTDETAYLIAELAEGSPFYISALFRSRFPHKDLATREGLLKTLEFETLDARGIIKGTWMEYIASALPRINQRYAKQIILYLCKHKDRKVSRRELKRELKIKMSDQDFMKKMNALIRADIISHNGSFVRYQAVQDNIFDKVFRGTFGDEIEDFEPDEDLEEFDERRIVAEYDALLKGLQEKYDVLRGKYSQMKGVFAEFTILKKLRTAFQHQDLFRSMITNLPDGFQFVNYESVWSYHGTAMGKPDFQVDIFARATKGTSIIGEVKNRERDKFSIEEAQQFLEKMNTLRHLERVTNMLGFIFSRSGFTQDAIEYLEEHRIVWSQDERWLD